MSALAASCFNRAIRLIQEGLIPRSIPYFAAALHYSLDGAIATQLPALRDALGQAVNRALAEERNQDALHLSGFLAVFDAAHRSGIAPDQALARSGRHAQAAAAPGDLDERCAHLLAAESLALDGVLAPAGAGLAPLREAVAHQLIERSGGEEPEPSLLSRGLAAMLSDAADLRVALAQALMQQKDYALVGRLCAEAQASRALDDAASLSVARLARQAALLDKGVSWNAAAIDAAAAMAASLEARIGDAPHTGQQLLMRFDCRMTMGLLGPALEDLRALSRMTPGDGWIAKQFCLLLRNVHFPESAAALETVVSDLRDDPAELRTWLGVAQTMGAPNQAVQIAKRLAAHLPEYAAIEPLHAMATDIYRAPALVLGAARSSGKRIYANVSCWGQRYLDLMEQALLASLLAPGNFPALSQEAALTLDIVTMPADLARVAAMPALQHLAEHCEIRIYLFPESVAPLASKMVYAIFGHGSHLTILRAARDGADLLFLGSDAFYADGSFATLAESLSDEAVALFADGLNAFAKPVLDELSPYGRDGVLSVPVSALIRSAAAHLTRRSTDNFYQPGNRWNSSAPTRLIFRTEDELRLHSFFKAPVYVSHKALAPLIQLDFRTTDGLFAEHLLYRMDASARLHLPSDRFAFVELCDDDGLISPLVEESFEDCVLRFFRDFYYDQRRQRLFETPAIFPAEGAPAEFVVSESEMRERLDSVRALFENNPQLRDQAREKAYIKRLYDAGQPSDRARGAADA